MNKLVCVLLLLIGISISSIVYAEIDSNNFCSQLPGSWIGETHIKNPTACNLANGCTHLITSTVEQLKANTYSLIFQFTNGVIAKEERVSISCENGVITLPSSSKYTVSTSCDSMNNCYLVYDDERFSAELTKK